MTRGGRKKTHDTPERTCIVSGESQPKAGLIRFVVADSPDTGEKTVIPDVLGKLSGRGFYVSSDRISLETAIKRKLFVRAARQTVVFPEELANMIEKLVLRHIIDLISMARKAGNAICGYEKVKDWLVHGKASCLIQAYDGSERTKERLRPPNGPETLISCLSACELGLAFGREHAIHAALATGGLERRIVNEAARLAGLRKQAVDKPA